VDRIGKPVARLAHDRAGGSRYLRGGPRITGRSHVYLYKLVRRGSLRREGGTSQTTRSTWLSRAEVEALALREYRRGRESTYWLTMSQAAEALGVARQHVYQMNLPTRQAGNGDLLVRCQDLAGRVLDRRRGLR
jgi:hypothetical protein